MSIKQKITVGPRDPNPGTIDIGSPGNPQIVPLASFWLHSRMQTWFAYDGEDWQPVVDWDFDTTPGVTRPLWGGIPSDDHQYGNMWLGYRNESRWTTDVFGLYDEFIVSTEDITAPGVAAASSIPTAPSGFKLK